MTEENQALLAAINVNTKHLDLSQTKINQLPDYITKLAKLDILYLNNNSFSELPHGINRLTTLKALSLDYNSLKTFPLQVATLANLVQLYVEHNELVCIRKMMKSVKKRRKKMPCYQFITAVNEEERPSF